MTTIELFHRIGRNARGGDFTRLSLSEQTDLAQAANTALQEVYNALPIYFKEQSQGFVLPAPLTVSLGVTQFSNEVSGTPFTEAQIGQSVAIDGDPGWNQILGVSTLLNPYMGESGTVNGTVYGDAAHSTTIPFDRIVADPRFANLQYAPLISSTLARGNQDPGIWFQQTIGRPQIWWTQAIGYSQGKKPVIVLKVLPAPDSAYAMNARMGFWPKRLTIADYQEATEIYVADQFLEKSLIPLAWRALMSLPAWGPHDESFNKRIELRALEAEAFLRQQPAQQSPRNQIFCPMGY